MRSQKPMLSQLDLARRVGLSQSTVSRIIDGSQLPTREQVGAICAAISEDRARRVELLVAWLHDEASTALVAGIDDRHYKILAVSENPDSALPASLAADLELIGAEAVAHEDVRGIVSNLAHSLLRHRAEIADAAHREKSDTRAQVIAFNSLAAEPADQNYQAAGDLSAKIAAAKKLADLPDGSASPSSRSKPRSK